MIAVGRLPTAVALEFTAIFVVWVMVSVASPVAWWDEVAVKVAAAAGPFGVIGTEAGAAVTDSVDVQDPLDT
ncbi:hypothetical protein ACLM5J_00885 [Nocardioides sp. Bht2]|uniref:hypothetical protein n=1 Tax=Nocardioides sp. Bht2 TaxID=3392297 RepID=UPI0039B3B908